MIMNQFPILSWAGARSITRHPSMDARTLASSSPIEATIKILLTPTTKFSFTDPAETTTEKISQQYAIVKELDRCRSSVYIVEDVGNNRLAIAKKAGFSEGDQLVLNSRLDHKSLVLCEDFIPAKDGNFLIYPYIEGISLHTAITIIHNEKQIRTDSDIDRHEANGELNGDLRFKLNILKSLTPVERTEILTMLKKKLLLSLADIAEALERMQEAGLSHGDLKPSNIISAYDGAHLIDFEGTRRYERPYVDHPIGRSINYIAPEELNHPSTHELSISLSKQGDQFNFASILYMVLTGEHPFFKFNEETEDRLVNREAPFPINEKENHGLNDLIMAGLNYNPLLRPSFAEYAQRLRSI